MSQSFRNLCKLTEMRLQVARAELQAHGRTIQALRSEIEDLRRRSQSFIPQSEEQMLIQTSGQFAKWSKLAQTLIAEKNMRLAEALARQEECFAKVRLAFAQDEAAANLAKRETRKQVELRRKAQEKVS